MLRTAFQCQLGATFKRRDIGTYNTIIYGFGILFEFSTVSMLKLTLNLFLSEINQSWLNFDTLP